DAPPTPRHREVARPHHRGPAQQHEREPPHMPPNCACAMSRIMPAGIAASAGAALANMAVVPEPFTTVKPVLAEGFPRAVTGEHACPMIDPLLRRRHCPSAIAPIGSRVGPLVSWIASV